MTHYCPDCDVGLVETDYGTSEGSEDIRVEAGGGLFGALSMEGNPVVAHVCPECRLVRFYAESVM
ncbi:hypothetical protein [Haloarchaeobius amylolyticus]|uniref:hypothetical protein n=1 Tax=Haloarchaeobius amylolyticus TaxID=1198296 RepID=UPI00226FDDEC|nr:hypothetical protein [Haloarchaeobius amylolyticus]